jgi:hypothetical protein
MPFPLDDFQRKWIESHFKKRLEWTEDYFLSMLESSRKSDVWRAVVALRECGTVKSIPHLKKLLYHTTEDVKCTSILTIAHISREKETSFYAEALLDPKYREKVYAMWAIDDAADERAVKAVVDYFNKNKSKLKADKLRPDLIIHGVRYLARHFDNFPEIQKIFKMISDSWPSFQLCGKLKEYREYFE